MEDTVTLKPLTEDALQSVLCDMVDPVDRMRGDEEIDAYRSLFLAAIDLLAACEQSEADAIAVADQLDRWARQSQTGGWSTHQVDPMRRLAANLRAYTGRRDAIAKARRAVVQAVNEA
jgi:hypothetical protein